ncbi:MAG TPA: Gfo/Idh/MocA family oxidoreductase [Terriglobales bacterium]|nr:Gfo/Idh/MocA family oxidoreductase [Terriglobales bacterium]
MDPGAGLPGAEGERVTPLRVGIAGYGYTGQIHARACLAQAGARLTAIADSNPERLKDLPAGVRACRSYQELLGSGVDAVNICLPTHLHCRAALDALASGKHVLVEKPIAVNLEEAQSMLRAAKAAGRALYVGMTHRFYPELQEAKKLVDGGAIGSIVACHDCALEHFGFLDTPAWYLEKKFAGGGPALTSGIHLVDRLRWFTGDEVKVVSGSAANPYFGADVEDVGQMFLRFRSGISAQVTVAFMREPHPLVCDLQVIGTRGSLIVHTWRGYEMWNSSGHQEKVFYTDQPHRAKVQVGIEGEISEFCSSIAEGRDPWPSPEDNVRCLRVLLAYYESARTGRSIELGDADAV